MERLMNSIRFRLLLALVLVLIFGTALSERASGQTWRPLTGSAGSKNLSSDADLAVQGYRISRVTFKGGTTVKLNEKGEVISGVLARDWLLNPQGYDILHLPAIGFKAGGEVTFNTRGFVVTGVLARDTNLFKQGVTTSAILYKAGTKVTFNEQGRVQR